MKDFEKQFGLRIKKLCIEKKEDDSSDEEVLVKKRVPERRDEAITDEYVHDAENFKDKIKSDYLKFRTEFRTIMDNIRTTEYE